MSRAPGNLLFFIYFAVQFSYSILPILLPIYGTPYHCIRPPTLHFKAMQHQCFASKQQIVKKKTNA
jgi:hypothetical protein